MPIASADLGIKHQSARGDPKKLIFSADLFSSPSMARDLLSSEISISSEANPDGDAVEKITPVPRIDLPRKMH
jgi:hypothetical protein